MNTPATSGVVLYSTSGAINAIDEYSRRLVSAMVALGTDARYVSDGMASLLASDAEPSWILLQYNPFSYGRSGFAPRFLRDAHRLRRRSSAPLVVMVHEAWVDMTDWRSSMIGLWQRAQLRDLLRLADAVMTSTEALAAAIGQGAIHVPVATNITPEPTSYGAARDRLGLDGKLAVALFGRGNPSRALDHAEAAIAALADAHGASRLAVLNLGVGAPRLRIPAGVEVASPGRLSPSELSLRLWASDLILLPFTDGISTRRTTLMAAFAHGRPVLGLTGHNTDAVLADAPDALALTPAGDPAAFARAAIELTRDPARMRAIGEGGRRLYESRFDWPVIAQSVTSMLDAISADRSAARSRSRAGRTSTTRLAASRPQATPGAAPTPVGDIIFVSHDIGGTGGMERVSEQLLNRLIDAGRPVTVFARTCRLAPRAGLRFVRVPTPGRPFAFGYPAFFAVASLMLMRRGETLVHATGAIVANRIDVNTVHYCHRAAGARVHAARASRPSLSYRVNAISSRFLSNAAEAWCYRPQRARVLCAVSAGVAAELKTGFPAMEGAVRTVPNGVDAAVFRPDAAARREVRAELGIDERGLLALFVGGDWERKGIAYAVDALAQAPGWDLAVAGPGDGQSLAARARAAGTESRLRLLGPVLDMPRLYAAADAFVLPTAYETFSLVTFEAAASGLPLLVTRVSGVEDLLQDGRNGWFVTRDASDIARRMNELRADSALAHRMGAAARAAAVHFSWEAMAEGYLSLYGELSAEGGGGGIDEWNGHARLSRLA